MVINLPTAGFGGIPKEISKFFRNTARKFSSFKESAIFCGLRNLFCLLTILRNPAAFM